WRIRFASDAAGTPDQRIICYKEGARDPYTVLWSEAGMPENSLIGQDDAFGSFASGDYIVTAPANWIYAGTGLTTGSRITGVVGYEYDTSDPNNGFSPAGLQILSHSPMSDGFYADSTVYTTASGATVVSLGSIQWSWGLDSYSSDYAAAHVD